MPDVHDGEYTVFAYNDETQDAPEDETELCYDKPCLMKFCARYGCQNDPETTIEAFDVDEYLHTLADIVGVEYIPPADTRRAQYINTTDIDAALLADYRRARGCLVNMTTDDESDSLLATIYGRDDEE